MKKDKVIENKLIIPELSSNIEANHSESFLQKGYDVVNRIIFISILTLGLLFLLVISFSFIFSIEIRTKGMGALEPAEFQEVRAEVNSTVNKIHVSNNDFVKQGDVLVELSDSEYKHQLIQAEKDLDIAKYELKRRLEYYGLSNSHFDDFVDLIDVRSMATGIIEKIYVRNDDIVEKGEILAELSSSEYKIKLFQAEKDHESAIAQLERITDLYKLSFSIYKDVIPELSDIKDLKSIPQVAMQKSIVERLEKEVLLYKNRIDDMKIVAPVSGRVLTPKLNNRIGTMLRTGDLLMIIGKTGDKKNETLNTEIEVSPEILIQQSVVDKMTQQVEYLSNRVEKTIIISPIGGRVLTSDTHKMIGKNISTGNVLMVIGNYNRWVVKTLIKEKDIPKVRLGDKAEIKFNAFPFMEYKTFTGTVVDIAYIPLSMNNSNLFDEENNNGNVNNSLRYTVTIELEDTNTEDNKKYNFQYGLLADVSILLARKKLAKYLWDVILGKLDFIERIDV